MALERRLSITRLMEDMLAAIRDPAHRREVTEQDGYDALAAAVAADQMARGEAPSGAAPI